MCDLKRNSKMESFTGYKVVLRHKRTGEFYSSAMGFKYPKDKNVPIVRKQKVLGGSWKKCILRSSYMFKECMEGRTAAFRLKTDAGRTLMNFTCGNTQKAYKPVLMKVRLSVDLMTGSYGWLNRRVVAGRRIEFLKEAK